MGPPFITAEWTIEFHITPRAGNIASMGPPFITAEWAQWPTGGTPRWVGCNAAAAHHDGVVTAHRTPRRRHAAFLNGAADHHGGVGHDAPRPRAGAGRFNGAAVHHGGVDRGAVDALEHEHHASMGPPFITAEWMKQE